MQERAMKKNSKKRLDFQTIERKRERERVEKEDPKTEEPNEQEF